MNKPLLEELKKAPTEVNWDYVHRLVQDSGASEHPIVFELEDNMGALSNITIGMAQAYLQQALAVTANDPNIEHRWERLYGTTIISENLPALIKNPAVINLTHAIAVVLIALLKEER